jgi:hypothetical protein
MRYLGKSIEINRLKILTFKRRDYSSSASWLELSDLNCSALNISTLSSRSNNKELIVY